MTHDSGAMTPPRPGPAPGASYGNVPPSAPDGSAHEPGCVERVNGKYAIERRLGGGGMAEVFLARTVGAEGFRRPVALKRILPGFSDSTEFARLFVSEAQLTSRLQHPNIVSILDFDRDDRGGLFLVMELVDGVDLDGLLDTGPLSFALVIHLAIEILSGLRYAHDLPLQTDDGVRGIVHRDISPHNVLVSWQGAVKVSDFGIAKSRAASQATASLLIKGKPAYMSPEQVSGRALDGRSDLFAVGVMLWQMLCQRPLFAGGTTEETITRLLYGTIAAPRVVCPDVPDDLSRAVMRLLSRDLAQRTPNADAAIADLFACADHPRDGRELLIQALAERFVGRAPVHAHRVTLASPTDPTRVVAPIPTPRKPAANGAVTLTAPGVRPRAPSRGRRRAWLVLAGAVLVTLVGGALWRSLPPRASTPRATGVDRPGADEPGRPAPPAKPALPADPTQDPDHLTPPSAPAGPERSGGTPNPSAPIDVPRPTPDTAPAPGSPRGRLDPAGAGSAGIREIRLEPARASTR